MTGERKKHDAHISPQPGSMLMRTATKNLPGQSRELTTDAQRWRAVVGRDRAAEGCFVYAVRTTGVYCRPGCPARLAQRRNVQFFATCAAAEAAGYRACRRCRPRQPARLDPQAAAVVRACRLLDAAAGPLNLADLARGVGLSPAHLHRLFRRQTGVTPKQYAQSRRTERLQTALSQSSTVTQALYQAGFQSSGGFYASAKKTLGMAPRALRRGSSGETIQYALADCALGQVLVAATTHGVCAILLGDSAAALERELQTRFPRAALHAGGARLRRLVARVVRKVARPATHVELPLDLRGTAFQCRVWRALCEIPPGSTLSYAQLAAQVGRPRAVRAVARACAANPLAVAVPCHRVVRSSGALADYRWGLARKQALLEREHVAAAGSGAATPARGK